MDYETIVEKYKKKGDRRKSTFVQLYFIEHRTPDEIQSIMVMNNCRSYYRIRSAVKRDIAQWYHSEKLDWEGLYKKYFHVSKKKAMFIRQHFIDNRDKEKIIDSLYLTVKEFYRLRESLLHEASKNACKE